MLDAVLMWLVVGLYATFVVVISIVLVLVVLIVAFKLIDYMIMRIRFKLIERKIDAIQKRIRKGIYHDRS